MTGLLDRFLPDGGIGYGAETMPAKPVGAITAAELETIDFPPLLYVVDGYIVEV